MILDETSDFPILKLWCSKFHAVLCNVHRVGEYIRIRPRLNIIYMLGLKPKYIYNIWFKRSTIFSNEHPSPVIFTVCLANFTSHASKSQNSMFFNKFRPQLIRLHQSDIYHVAWWNCMFIVEIHVWYSSYVISQHSTWPMDIEAWSCNSSMVEQRRRIELT